MRVSFVMLLLSLAPLTMSCGEELHALHLVIDTDLRVPDHLDELEVTITAARPSDSKVCSARERNFALHASESEPPYSLPVEILLEPGQEFTKYVVYRVRAKVEGVEKLRVEGAVGWPELGVGEHRIDLPLRCWELTCPEGQHCAEICDDAQPDCGEYGCVDVPAPGVFANPVLIDESRSCDADDLLVGD